MKKVKLKLPHRLPAVMLGCLVAPLAQAQTATAALPEVVVQSGRLAQKQFDTAGSVASVGADEIRASGPQVNVSDVLAKVPGVAALNRNNYAQDLQISIRGFGARAAFGMRGIRLITDGIPATTPDGQAQASTISLTSTDRLEVLTGPLAQIYGNASGGVIQSFTREASDRPEFASQIYTGSYGMKRTDWQFSQRTGSVGLVADYSTFVTGGYRANSDARRQQFNGVITVEASPDTRWKLVTNLFDMPQARDPLGLTLAQLANPSQGGYGSGINSTRKTVSQRQAGAVLDHRINREVQFSARAYTGTRDNLQYQALANAGNPNNANGRWTGLERHFYGLGLQLNGKAKAGAVPFDWVVGLDRDRSAEVRQAGATLNGVKTAAGATRNELNQSDNQDYFAQANWFVSDRWTLTTGLRRSNVTLRSLDYYLVDGVDGTGSVRYSASNPVLGATWHVKDTLNLYANAGKGLETPTLAEAAFVSSGGAAVGQFNPGLQASTSLHREVGAKWTPAPTTRVSAALFRITTDNEIVADVSTFGSTAYINATRTLREGLELSWQQLWTPHWKTDVNATVMKAIYDQSYSSAASGTISAGNQMPSVPSRQFFAGLRWSEAGFASAGKARGNGFEADLDVVARARIYANDRNTSSAAGYGLVNTRVRYRVSQGRVSHELYAGVDNLADRAYVGSVIVNQSSAQFFEPGLPRNWVLGWSLKARFD
jgi:iron complex outermembrane receptor protein